MKKRRDKKLPSAYETLALADTGNENPVTHTTQPTEEGASVARNWVNENKK